MAESHAVGWSPTRRDAVFLVLAGVFITHALLGEVVGGKLVVFVTTDLVNEYYGPRAVRRLTLLAVVLIAYAFVVLYLCMSVSASGISPVSDAAFTEVFGQSMWIIVGSIIAFAL